MEYTEYESRSDQGIWLVRLGEPLDTWSTRIGQSDGTCRKTVQLFATSRETTQLMPSTSRPRIIPARRPLLPPRSSFSTSQSPKSVNPSSKPADIQIRKPAFSSLPALSGDDTSNIEERLERDQPMHIECDFSRAPQPFLDPDVWSRMQRHGQMGLEKAGSGDLEEEERRREREAEYGGMAIQGRTARRRT